MTRQLIRVLLAGILALGLPGAVEAKGTGGSHSSGKSGSKSGSTKSKSSGTSHGKSSTAKKSRKSTEAQKRDSHGRIARSEEAKSQFMRQTGYPHGRKGYVVDHIVPLACGGSDAPWNMQWQTAAEAKAKDKIERTGCH